MRQYPHLFSPVVLDCTGGKQQNSPWNHPHHKLKPDRKPCGSIHHNRGNAFLADAVEQDMICQDNMVQREKKSFVVLEHLRVHPARKNEKNGATGTTESAV